MEDLPKDLVTKILLDLKLEDLLHCKSVCKSWYSLITSPSFNAQHLKVSNNDPHLLFYYKDKTTKDSTFSSLSHQTLEVVKTIPALSHTQFHTKWSNYEILGCCNGVVCLCYPRHDFKHDIILWNPTTRDAKIVPKKKFHRCIAIGFGFDAKNNDYKVVSVRQQQQQQQQRGFKVPHGPFQSFKCVVEVYSLKANSWKVLLRNIPTSVLIINTSGLGLCTSGMFSWSIADKGYRMKIISFDMSNEEIKSTPLPPCISGIYINGLGDNFNTLVAYNESNIAIANHKGDNYEYNIWRLGQFGVMESWTKLFTIGPLEHPEREVIGFWKNDQVFVATGEVSDTSEEGLVLIEPATQERKKVHIYGHWITPMRVFNFKQSLVRLNGTAF